MRSRSSYLLLAVIGLFGISAYYYSDFISDDAFIVYRYAENWVRAGTLEYNLGERINALTSPLHGLIAAAVFLVSGATVLGNRMISVAAVVVATLIVWHRFRGRTDLQLFVLASILLAPCIVVWTFGGLETPYLLLLATIAAVLSARDSPASPVWLCLLGGVGFLVRYDAALYFAPLVFVAIWRARRPRQIGLALAAATILPALWIGISFYFYGDIFPTSYYVKTPRINAGKAVRNGAYIVTYLLSTGILPALALPALFRLQRAEVATAARGNLRRFSWLYVALASELIYGLAIATTHMMFAFRSFVPYIPALVLAVTDWLERTTASDAVSGFARIPRRNVIMAAGLCVVLSQVGQLVRTYDRSLNGFAPIGELRAMGVHGIRDFTAVLAREATDIRSHWTGVAGPARNVPRIYTHAAGVLPYELMEAYIYEALVSYRHCQPRVTDMKAAADYLQIVAPVHGTVAEQLPLPVDQYELVAAYDVRYNGEKQASLVYYNPHPRDYALPTRIDGACP